MSIFRFAAVAATLLGGATMIVSPVAAATRTVPITVPLSARPAQAPAWSSTDEIYNDHRWRGHRGHHNGFDGGDLLGVLLIGGGIAAVAAAIDKDKQERSGDRTDGRAYPEADDREYDDRSDGTRARDQGYGRNRDETGPDRPYDYNDSRVEGRQSGQLDSRETDRAVDVCSAEAARSGEVDEIFDIEKIDGEWRVKGDYRDGRDFTCTVDGNGKAYVGLGDHAANANPIARPADGADDRYATGRSPDFSDPRGR